MAHPPLLMSFNRPVKITECNLFGEPITETKRFLASSARSNVVKELRNGWELHFNYKTLMTMFKGNSILFVEED